MKIYTYYTESHRYMFENWFKPSVVDLEIISTIGNQDCPSGSYYSDGWKKTTMKKVDVFIQACKENMGGAFVFSDVDIQFFGPIKDVLLSELGDFDMAIQNDYSGGMCSGFFVCKGNERTLALFQSMKANESQYLEDQYALNMNLKLCKYKPLSKRFWTFGMFGQQWKGQNFEIPNDILMHHANWVEGIDNKVKLLQLVKTKVSMIEDIRKNLDNYQSFLNKFFEEFRPVPNYPIYPPYHTGKYLEGYFYDFFRDKKLDNIYYLPIDWTTCYIQGYDSSTLVNKLLSLDRSKKYFTISQHDDAIKEYLPQGTIKYCAGGNMGGTPIPLVCSEIPKNLIKEKEKDIFCSFVGSITHPIRSQLYNTYKYNPKYKFHCKQWTNNVSDNDLETFIDITTRSKFTLCPRGYGRSSFRMYEAMQIGSVPVYIYDEDWRPFISEIKWDDFSVSIHSSNLGKLDSILSSYSDELINKMISKGKEIYENHFSLPSLSKKIFHSINIYYYL